MATRTVIAFCLVALPVAWGLCGAMNSSAAQEHSALWGANGELWTPDGRLPDWSFAGYERGEAPVPARPATHNVKDFGAMGDGDHDDTEAFQRAVAEVQSGVIEIPPGRYVITDIIEIRNSDLVLRGAGKNETTLYFPRTLTDVRPNWGATTSGTRTSNYSWSGGFIWVTGDDAGESLSAPGAAKRGDTQLSVTDAASCAVGQEIMLVLHDDADHSLTQYIYADDPGDIENIGQGLTIRQVFRVIETRDDVIVVDRPLRADIRPEWQPTLRTFKPSVTRVGIEDMTFEFPDTPYEGHFTELGHNGIAMSQVAHCWIRNVHFQNAESGIFFHGRFSLIDGVSYHSTREGDRFDNRGHHGATISGEDNVFANFDFEMRFIHDLTVTSGSIGNVFSNGRGVDVNFDHHRRGPYENLFTNIDVGKGSRVWASGGGQALGKHCAARGTFWNLRANNPLKPPAAWFAPSMINIVGVTTEESGETSDDGPWFETIAPHTLHPQNIHEAQQQRRLESP